MSEKFTYLKAVHELLYIRFIKGINVGYIINVDSEGTVTFNEVPPKNKKLLSKL